MKSAVVAYDRNRGIGADNDLLWMRDLPADLQHLKQLTTGKSIIMGRKTFESIGRRPLPNRQNIVLSRTPTGVDKVITAGSLEAAYAMAQFPIVIFGGASVYRDALPDIDTIYATEVGEEFPQATVFFPALDMNEWQEVSREHHDADEKNKYPYDFVVYRRRARDDM
jgi:dihydrofolate reductase